MTNSNECITRDYSLEALEVFCMYQEKTINQFEREVLGSVQKILTRFRDKLCHAVVSLDHDRCAITLGLTNKHQETDVSDRISTIDSALARRGWENVSMWDSPCNTLEALKGYASFVLEDR